MMVVPRPLKQKPALSTQSAERMAKALYGLEVTAQPLAGELDQNFLLTDQAGAQYVLKVANPEVGQASLDLQNQALDHLQRNATGYAFPRVVPTLEGEPLAQVHEPTGSHWVRLLTFLPGVRWADVIPSFTLLRKLGVLMGTVDKTLATFSHPATHRYWPWDLKHANVLIRQSLPLLECAQHRALVERFLASFETRVLPLLSRLRTGVIHNDANDHNVLLDSKDPNKLVGLIDFGDMVHSALVFEPAVACAYALLGSADPLEAMCEVVVGYHQVNPLTEDEFEVLFPCICVRLSLSVCMSAAAKHEHSLDEYLSVSEQPAWDALEKLDGMDPIRVEFALRRACGFAAPGLSHADILGARTQHLNPALSIAYKKPLKIVRGWMQYLYDGSGKPYLDMVNNVCHVGHCHSKVVQAAQRQMALLNTNTRYLHDLLVRFAEKLCDTLPEPLSVCTFVCSGSEANDLALRMAEACTGGTDVIVVDGAYHGNLSSLVEISPYKFNGPGGRGKPDHVHVAPLPDPYRGLYRGYGVETGAQYARHALEAIEQLQARGRRLKAFVCESIQGVGGQVVMPDGFLQEAYRHVRNAGGVCIADEVQVGLGRVGAHFWAFEAQGVVPDIVTIGKPLGNGHPVAAVVTTSQIAKAFHNGMEFFNTFGGNPVSCAAGLAVLEVIGDEKLQQRALEVGSYLKSRLDELKEKHALIGDVRGLGLFLGIELVLNRKTLKPAPQEAARLSERLKEEGILVTTEGPLHNVLKIKPPLAFNRENADFFVEALAQLLQEVEARERL